MVQGLQEAEQKLDAFRQIQKTLELQHQQAMQEIETKVKYTIVVTPCSQSPTLSTICLMHVPLLVAM